MALTKLAVVTSADLIALKLRVKNEMLRRNGNGDLSAYAGASYDFSATPAKRGSVKLEHYAKTQNLVNIVAGAVGNKARNSGKTQLNTTSVALAAYEAKPRNTQGSGNDCSAACTGTCVSACTTTCTGCSGSCTGSCTSCTGSCTSCSGCSGGCSGCSGSCTGSCDGCSGSCTSCSGCSGGCSGCSGSCDGSCSGCSGSCSAYCASSCSNCDGGGGVNP